MIIWLLLVSLFCESTQDGNNQENGVLHCGPQNLISTSSDKTIRLTWEDASSCSSLKDMLIYELLVLIADEQVHYEEVDVTPDQIGSPHSWSWTSPLVLECASVRLRSRYKNQTSLWKQEQALPAGRSNSKVEVFPRDRLLEVGSRFTFCCFVPAGKIFKRMYLVGYDESDMNTTQISNQTYVLTVHLNRPECPDGSAGRCKMAVRVDAEERNFTLTATNTLGKVVLSDAADLTKRVHMYPPVQLRASTVNARNVTLEWEWGVPQYSGLNITCQVHIGHCETATIREISGVGLRLAVLNDLMPHRKYTVRVQCGTTPHVWKWSNCSQNVIFHTRGDVPDALDVWIQLKGHHIIIVWKELLANQSHGHIKDYEVTWSKSTEREQQNRVTVHNKTRHELSLDTTEEYIVTVTARNKNGSSSPSTITIPRLSPDRTERVNTSRILGSSGSFHLSWSASPVASCGYIVDWCPTVGQCEVEWLKVPPNETSAIVSSETFTDGVRYSLSVYACTQGAPVLLERREGYVREKKIEGSLFEPLTKELQDSCVKVSWNRIDPRNQSAFIQGYVLLGYFSDSGKIAVNVSTDDPYATSLTAENLKFTSYKFEVMARTAVGECGTMLFEVTLYSPAFTLPDIIALVCVFSLLSLITILCYRHWACIRQKVYPPIPKPVLRDEFFTSLEENSCRPLGLTEAEDVAVSELYYNPEMLQKGYVSEEEDVKFVYTPTPKGYYNQPLKKNIPPSLTLPPTAIPFSSGLPSAPFRGEYPNPSYNLVLLTGDQQSDPGPEVQERPALQRCSSGYQPQSNPVTFTENQTTEDTLSPMSCSSTYILLPQSA
ncbi:leukemia inhibitory factor receptor-like [Symphorus nematophorus]